MLIITGHAIDLYERPVYTADLTGPVMLMMGNETMGLNKDYKAKEDAPPLSGGRRPKSLPGWGDILCPCQIRSVISPLWIHPFLRISSDTARVTAAGRMKCIIRIWSRAMPPDIPLSVIAP